MEYSFKKRKIHLINRISILFKTGKSKILVKVYKVNSFFLMKEKEKQDEEVELSNSDVIVRYISIGFG